MDPLIRLPGYPYALGGEPLKTILVDQSDRVLVNESGFVMTAMNIEEVRRLLAEDIEEACAHEEGDAWEGLHAALRHGKARAHLDTVLSVEVSSDVAQISFVPAGASEPYGMLVRRFGSSFPATFPIPLDGDVFEFESFTPVQLRLLDAVEAINRDLLYQLRRTPRDLDNLSPRAFEELIADLLREMGYAVELTRASKDGGVDIFARLATSSGSFLAVIDCKRYRIDRRIGVDKVRALAGLVWQECAEHAAFVATTYATGPARKWLAEHGRGQCAVHDRDRVLEWIERDRWTRSEGGILLPPG